MDQLVKQALDQYFSDFKEYHLIILITFTLIIALLQIIQSFVISSKIEKFKNELKKSEIKFSRYNELQVIALRNIYLHLLTLQRSYNMLFKAKPSSIGHVFLKTRISAWIKDYFECADEFAKQKILLTPKLKQAYIHAMKDFDEVNQLLIQEREYINYCEDEYQGDWAQIYDYEAKEIEVISNKLDKIKENKSVNEVNNHILALRKDIEDLFEKMV